MRLRPLAIATLVFATAGCYRIGPVFGRDGGDAGSTDAGTDGAIPTSTCGNGIVERATNPPEFCDDGNRNDTDLCRNTCTRRCVPPGSIRCDEHADDCTSGMCDMSEDSCVVVRAPVGTPCTSGAGCVGGVCTLPPYDPTPPSTCGNGILERAADPPEFCDDGNANDGDLCKNDCTRPCLPPAPPGCSEHDDECTWGACNFVTGSCEVALRPVGSPCTSGAGCIGGMCTLRPFGGPSACGLFSSELCTFLRPVQASALATDGARLYWAEGGMDGVVRAVSLDGGHIETIATGLPSPIELGVTPTHVYVSVDRWGAGADLDAIVRVPLRGGAIEIVAENARMFGGCSHCFVASGDRAFFPLSVGGSAIVIATSSATVPAATTFADVPEGVVAMHADASHLYFETNTRPGEIRRVPLAGGAPEPVLTLPGLENCPFALLDDMVYAVECVADYAEIFIGTQPLSGGTWTRLTRILRWHRPGELRMVSADRWITRGTLYTDYAEVRSGSFAAGSEDALAWDYDAVDPVATDRGVFFADDGAIRRAGW